jgi:type IV pilus assembly protein PilY1
MPASRLRATYRLLLAAGVAALSATPPVLLAATDIADTPLASAASDQVKPNIFFILDDSGSMDRDYMPDGVGTSTIGYRNHLCNTVYYKPATSYVIPQDDVGVNLNSASQTTFTTARNDGYDSYTGNSSGTTDLTGRYYWRFMLSGTPVPNAGACNYSSGSVTSSTTGICCKTSTASVGSSTCDNAEYTTNSPPACTNVTTVPLVTRTLVWQKVPVTSTSGPGSTDERQNFANWHTYYRTRLMMMKAASGRAFDGISDRYRVGFMTISPGTYSSSGAATGSDISASKFLKIADFATTHRASWYSKLYSQETSGYTPLRSALSTAGRYYAGKNDLTSKGMIPTQADDPVQYSCQQNFTILTTDGYWNSGSGRQINGTSEIGNQDGNISEQDAYNTADHKFAVSPRPLYDGATALYVWNQASNRYQTASCVLSTQLQQRTIQWQRRQARFYRCKADGSSCSSIDFDCSSGTGSTTRPLCKVTNDTGWVNRATCTPGYSDPPTTTLCRTTSDSGWIDVASCTPSAPTGGPEVTCRSNDTMGYKIQYRTTTAATTYPGPNRTGSIVSGPTCSTGSWIDVTPATCYAAAPALPASGDGACPPTGGEVIGSGPPSPPSGCTAWPCETFSSTGGSSNTLADVAQYYYKTDLRTSALGNCTGALGVSVCDNNVPSTGTGAEDDDKANWQHMTSFTMGLGLDGTLAFSSTYKTDTTGTFANIRAGSVNWPVPSANSATAIDDLWHAAVDGRGQYFSARDPSSVIDGLQSALSGINARVASAAAAATSNLEPVAGDNFAYTAKYTTVKWTGELEAREIDLATGAVSGTAIWSAQTKLDALTKAGCDNRDIKLFRSGAAGNLVAFKSDTYTCDAAGVPTGTAVTTLNGTELAYFDSTEVGLLSQYPQMSTGVSPSTVNQRALAAGSNMVNFIRGQRGKEGFDSGPPATSDNADKLFRIREHILGDIVNAQPVFVKAPFAEYTDAGYVTFRSNQAGRTPMVYVAANDGMLHAFKAGTSITDTEGGKEAWAFIPTMVLPNLYTLASENYANQHMYSVDGTPTAADVFDPTASADCALATPTNPQNCWKTILVGGLNKGGKGYYALDVTDPAAPTALWEFKNSTTCLAVDPVTKAPTAPADTDCHIGYTFNNPIVGKLANGTWAVFVTSGYNNDDGNGYLYVLNAITGKVIYRIATGVGTAADPSGLNHINAWVDNALFNNTIDRVYGVDLKGNVWRFDVNNSYGTAGREAILVTQVVDPGNTPQPITTRPELAEVDSYPFVYVATGRYLGQTDKPDTQVQTVWAIKDPMTDTAIANPRTALNTRVISNVGSGLSAYRTITAASGCIAANGWFADLPDSGERVNIDIKLQLGTLVVPSNVPSTNACNIGGYGWLNYFNYKTGCAVATSEHASVGERLVGATGTESLAVGTNIVRLPGGKTVVIATTSAAEQITFDVPFDTPPPTGKRVSWREVVQ